jgi:hypothetical protein
MQQNAIAAACPATREQGYTMTLVLDVKEIPMTKGDYRRPWAG